MDEMKVDLFWSDPARLLESPRQVFVGDVLRYAQGANQQAVELDGFVNYHWLTSPGDLGRTKIMLEAGINAPAEVSCPDVARRPLIAIRSSPWKAGHETNPWHDEFDLDHGHVRYFVTTSRPPSDFPEQRRGTACSWKRPDCTLARLRTSACWHRHYCCSAPQLCTATAAHW